MGTVVVVVVVVVDIDMGTEYHIHIIIVKRLSVKNKRHINNVEMNLV